MDPLQRVRETTAWVLANAGHVSIGDEHTIDAAAEELYREAPESVKWDADGWHFQADASEGGPLTAQYVLALDSINFCFWPSTTEMEYDHVATALKSIIERDSGAFDAERLARVTAQDVAAWLAPHHVPLAEERATRLQEVGQVLLAEFDGLAYNLVQRAERSATKLVRLLASHFPGFRDEAVYQGRQIMLYKRAQILVGDMWAAYGKPGADAPDTLLPFAFTDLHRLTMFADYRVPQPLRALNVLQYSEDLAARVDRGEELAAGSAEEIEIRAGTVVAVEALGDALRRRGKDVMSLQLDWWLWQSGESRKNELPAHHKCLTMFY